jgi:hypothetical protein|tara:strand:- start:907 stop:1671 length:765 start_codon:yes stop_codon:yes gene_type:complete
MNNLLSTLTAEQASLIAVNLSEFERISIAESTLRNCHDPRPSLVLPWINYSDKALIPEDLTQSNLLTAQLYREALEEEIEIILKAKYSNNTLDHQTVLEIYEEKFIIDSIGDCSSDFIIELVKDHEDFKQMLDVETTTVTRQSVAVWFFKNKMVEIARIFDPYIEQLYSSGYEYYLKAKKNKQRGNAKGGGNGRTYTDEHLNIITPFIQKLKRGTYSTQDARNDIHKKINLKPSASTISEWKVRLAISGTLLKS